MKFRARIYELHLQSILVEADSKEEAIEKILQGEFEVDGPTEYVSTQDDLSGDDLPAPISDIEEVNTITVQKYITTRFNPDTRYYEFAYINSANEYSVLITEDEAHILDYYNVEEDAAQTILKKYDDMLIEKGR